MKLTDFFKHRISIIACCLALASLPMSVSAQQLSAAEIANSAQEQTGGRVLKVRLANNGSTDYRVKVLLPKGKVRQLLVDGNSGEIKGYRKPKARTIKAADRPPRR